MKPKPPYRVDVFYQAQIGAIYWHVKLEGVHLYGNYGKADAMIYARALAKVLPIRLYVEGKRTAVHPRRKK